MTTFLSIVFCLISILMILVILVQRGRGGGLAGAFGGGGGGTTAFGTKTGDVFTWVTVILFAFFLVLAIYLNLRFRTVPPVPGAAVSTSLPALETTSAPATMATSAPAASTSAPATSPKVSVTTSTAPAK